MNYSSINLQEKLTKFTEHWSPKIITQLNDYHLKLVKVQGEFVWHDHPDTDDFFLVLSGKLTIDLPGGDVALNPGEVFVVPKGVHHRPRAEVETHLLLIEPAGTPITGDPATAATKVHI